MIKIFNNKKAGVNLTQLSTNVVYGVIAFILVLAVGGFSAPFVVMALAQMSGSGLAGASLYSQTGLVGFLYGIIILVIAIGVGFGITKYTK